MSLEHLAMPENNEVLKKQNDGATSQRDTGVN